MKGSVGGHAPCDAQQSGVAPPQQQAPAWCAWCTSAWCASLTFACALPPPLRHAQDLLRPERALAAARLAGYLALEDGVGGAVESLHAHMASAGVFEAKRRAMWRELAAEHASATALSKADHAGGKALEPAQPAALRTQAQARTRAPSSTASKVADDSGVGMQPKAVQRLFETIRRMSVA